MDKSPDEIEEAVEPVPIGLPKCMEHFTRRQMSEWMQEVLRSRGQSKEQSDEPSD